MNRFTHARPSVAVSATAPPDWEAARKALSAGLYHSTDYANILSARGNLPLYFHHRSADGTIDALCLGWLTDQWRSWPKSAVYRNLHTQAQPLVAATCRHSREAFAKAILSHARAIGVSGVVLGSEGSAQSAQGLETEGLTPKRRLEYVLDLRRDQESLLGAMQARRRTQLRKLSRENSLTMVEDPGPEALRALMVFQASSRDRRQARGERYSVGSIDSYRQIWRHYVQSGFARAFFIEADGERLCGVLLHCLDSQAYYTLAGSSSAGFARGAPVYLVWEAMRLLKDQGFTSLNLGGTGLSARDPEDLAHGLYRFKANFGAEQVECTTWQTQQMALPRAWAAFLTGRRRSPGRSKAPRADHAPDSRPS